MFTIFFACFVRNVITSRMIQNVEHQVYTADRIMETSTTFFSYYQIYNKGGGGMSFKSFILLYFSFLKAIIVNPNWVIVEHPVVCNLMFGGNFFSFDAYHHHSEFVCQIRQHYVYVCVWQIECNIYDQFILMYIVWLTT